MCWAFCLTSLCHTSKNSVHKKFYWSSENISNESEQIIRHFQNIIRHFNFSVHEKIFRWSDNVLWFWTNHQTFCKIISNVRWGRWLFVNTVGMEFLYRHLQSPLPSLISHLQLLPWSQTKHDLLASDCWSDSSANWCQLLWEIYNWLLSILTLYLLNFSEGT